jgi:hypothetical protein
MSQLRERLRRLGQAETERLMEGNGLYKHESQARDGKDGMPRFRAAQQMEHGYKAAERQAPRYFIVGGIQCPY